MLLIEAISCRFFGKLAYIEAIHLLNVIGIEAHIDDYLELKHQTSEPPRLVFQPSDVSQDTSDG